MKKIFITIPSFAVHGGIRIILEWANRLTAKHTVYLRVMNYGRCNWFPISSRVRQVRDDASLKGSDILIITSPHSIGYTRHRWAPRRIFGFLQMAEHMFCPTDERWQMLCREMYQMRHPLILISRWNQELIERDYGRVGQCHQVGNGVNFGHFPIEQNAKDGTTVLVEGWNPGNPTKDVDRLGARVAARLKADGYRIAAYGAGPSNDYSGVLSEYHVRPDLITMNNLYRQATILIKASLCDARACAPVEAMTKGTVTARAINDGDDDLIHNENCLRSGYNEDDLYLNAKRLLTDQQLRQRLAIGCIAHVQRYSWDYWMPKIDYILCRS